MKKSKTDMFIKFECYDNEGNFKGYFISETDLDEYAQAVDLADENGNHTEASDEMFKTEYPCFLDYADEENREWAEYEIIPFE
jgi:hypothetical protein